MIKKIALIAASIVAFSTASIAADWSVDTGKSEVKFSGTHAGNAFTGVFEKWTAAITFDPADLANAHVRVEFDPNSAKTGNGLYDGTLKGDDWFKVNSFKSAVFDAATFTHKGGNMYVAEGTLQIRDKTLPLTLEFTLDITGNSAVMTAKHSLDRIAYDLGVQSDADASWVSKEIGLAIKLVASH